MQRSYKMATAALSQKRQNQSRPLTNALPQSAIHSPGKGDGDGDGDGGGGKKGWRGLQKEDGQMQCSVAPPVHAGHGLSTTLRATWGHGGGGSPN